LQFANKIIYINITDFLLVSTAAKSSMTWSQSRIFFIISSIFLFFRNITYTRNRYLYTVSFKSFHFDYMPHSVRIFAHWLLFVFLLWIVKTIYPSLLPSESSTSPCAIIITFWKFVLNLFIKAQFKIAQFSHIVLFISYGQFY